MLAGLVASSLATLRFLRAAEMNMNFCRSGQLEKGRLWEPTTRSQKPQGTTCVIRLAANHFNLILKVMLGCTWSGRTDDGKIVDRERSLPISQIRTFGVPESSDSSLKTGRSFLNSRTRILKHSEHITSHEKKFQCLFRFQFWHMMLFMRVRITNP